MKSTARFTYMKHIYFFFKPIVDIINRVFYCHQIGCISDIKLLCKPNRKHQTADLSPHNYGIMLPFYFLHRNKILN